MPQALAALGSALVGAGSVFAGFLAFEAYKHKATSPVDVCKANPVPAVGMLLGVLAMLLPSIPVPKVALPSLPVFRIALPRLPAIALPKLALPTLPRISFPTLAVPNPALPPIHPPAAEPPAAAKAPTTPPVSMSRTGLLESPPATPPAAVTPEPASAFKLPSLSGIMDSFSSKAPSANASAAESPRRPPLELLLAELHDHDDAAPLPSGVSLDAEYKHTRALESFVPQHGPVCAAASVAGVLNVLFGAEAGGGGSFRVRDGMRVYRAIFDRKRAEALDKLQKVIRADPAPLPALLLTQDLCVAARSKHKERFKDALAAAVAAAAAREDLGEPDAACLAVISDAVSSQRPSSALVIERVRVLARSEWSVAKLQGRWPLPSGKILPSTAPIGNDRIVQCLKVLALLREGSAVRCTSFMSARAPCRHVVSKGISDEDKERLWGDLKIAIENQSSALIFHLHNHYALIFGWRELTTDVAGKRRQILCARVGQEPAHWIDWEGDFTAFSKTKGKDLLRKSVLTTLTSWVGHKIMLAEIPSFSSKRATVDPAVLRLVERLKAAPEPVSEDDGSKEADAESDAPSEEAQGSDDEPES